MDAPPTIIHVALLGGPLDGDDALIATPLPLWRWFANGWDVEEGHAPYPYALRLDGQGKVFYVWVARGGR